MKEGLDRQREDTERKMNIKQVNGMKEGVERRRKDDEGRNKTEIHTKKIKRLKVHDVEKKRN